LERRKKMKRSTLILVVTLLMASSALGETVYLRDSVYEADVTPITIQIKDSKGNPIVAGHTVVVGETITITCHIVASARAYWSGSGAAEYEYKAQLQSSLRLKRETNIPRRDDHDIQDTDLQDASKTEPGRTLTIVHTLNTASDYWKVEATSNAYASYSSVSSGGIPYVDVATAATGLQELAFKVVATPSDTTPPVITCPEDITVHVGQGETGAVVDYVVTATDDVTPDEDIVIDCVPASGSTFPVGDTLVTCTATDAAGNQATGTFTISVLRPTELVEDLADDVYDLNLHHGIENSLDAKLDSALNALDDLNENNDVAAVNSLEAFINAVQAQSGKKIPEADGNILITDAQLIIDLLLAG
jgi:hypothetical protein